jgi:peroxiredoxin
MMKIINFLKTRKSDAAGIIVFIGLFFVIQWWQTRNLVAKNQPVPELILADTTGKIHNLKDYQGKSVVLYFFAPWCSICKATTGNLEYLKKIRGTEKLEIISIGLDFSDSSEIESYAKAHNMTVPVLPGNDDISRQFKIRGFPTVYFVDEKGLISTSSLGYISTAGLFFRSF